MNARAVALVAALALSAMLARDAASAAPQWSEIKWPFLLDQWGTGRAFRCGADACGGEVTVYVRPKIGFCNCANGVSDDAELDRVADVSLLSDKYAGLAASRPVTVGWMSGRSRVYDVTPAYSMPLKIVEIAFNDKCDVIVATVTASGAPMEAAESAALAFVNSPVVLSFARTALGL